MTISNCKINPCKFCKQNIFLAPFQDTYGCNIYVCNDCSAQYIYWKDNGQYYYVSIHTIYNDKIYRCTIYNDLIQLLCVKTIGINADEIIDLIKDFKVNLPNITPDNFLDKLSVYLLFL